MATTRQDQGTELRETKQHHPAAATPVLQILASVSAMLASRSGPL